MAAEAGHRAILNPNLVVGVAAVRLLRALLSAMNAPHRCCCRMHLPRSAAQGAGCAWPRCVMLSAACCSVQRLSPGGLLAEEAANLASPQDLGFRCSWCCCDV